MKMPILFQVASHNSSSVQIVTWVFASLLLLVLQSVFSMQPIYLVVISILQLLLPFVSRIDANGKNIPFYWIGQFIGAFAAAALVYGTYSDGILHLDPELRFESSYLIGYES